MFPCTVPAGREHTSLYILRLNGHIFLSFILLALLDSCGGLKEVQFATCSAKVFVLPLADISSQITGTRHLIHEQRYDTAKGSLKGCQLHSEP